jgi:hypothetical protein
MDLCRGDVVAELANAILALAEGGEANDNDNDNNKLGGKRGERRRLDDHDDDNNDSNNGTDGPCHRCLHCGSRVLFLVASEDQLLTCWTLSNLETPQGIRL